MDPETLLEAIRYFASRLTTAETRAAALAEQNDQLRAELATRPPAAEPHSAE